MPRRHSLSLGFHLHRRHKSQPSETTRHDADTSSMDSTATPSTESPLPSPALTKTDLAAAARETRDHLHTVVRNDWEFPAPPALAPPDLPPDTPYLQRTFSLSSPSPSPSRSPLAANASAPCRTSRNIQSHDPYRFADPSAIGSSILERKAKRQRILREEVASNAGLRTFMARRNAWTGALFAQMPNDAPVRHDVVILHSIPDPLVLAQGQIQSPLEDTVTPATEHTPSSPRTFIDDNATELLPLSPPLIHPSHPVRARISEASYPAIYTRVVVQGTRPSVPINLADMTRALVKGWQSDGEWPPKQAALDPLVGRRRARRSGGGRMAG